MNGPENVPGWRRDLGDSPTVGDTQDYALNTHEIMRPTFEDIVFHEAPRQAPGGLTEEDNYVQFADGTDCTEEEHIAKVRSGRGEK